MRRRWYYIVGVICCAIVLAYVFFRPPAEPSYEGRTLSEWLDDEYHSERTISAFTNAIAHMGTNAVPFLIEHIKYEEKRWTTATSQYLRNHYPTSPTAMHMQEWLSGPSGRKWMAAYAFNVFQPHADTFAPLLAQYLDRPQSAFFAARALIFLGEKGYPPIVATLTNDQTICAEMITVALQFAETNAAPAIPALTHNLQSTNSQLALLSQIALTYITNRNTGPTIR